MIVQELTKLQSRLGWLPKEDLRALAERIDEPLHRLHEVASCFPHFRLAPPPAVDVRVCRDTSCYLHGSHECRRRLETVASEHSAGHVAVGGVSCLGRCDGPPAVAINDHIYHGKSTEEVEDLVRCAARGEALPMQHGDASPAGWKIDPYNGQPRYDQIRRLVDAWTKVRLLDAPARYEALDELFLKVIGPRNEEESRREAKDPGSGSVYGAGALLKGLGGNGFPAAQKWFECRNAPSADGRRYVIANGDESEPGTFKDRELLLRAPHLVVEGIVVAGLLIGAERGYIYIRHEYHEQVEAVRRAIAEAERGGFCGKRILGSDLSFPVEVFVSPGGYICGEESALIEAMEDRRAEPRNKPPDMRIIGLRDRPTVVNNVETLSWVPAILTHGARWYRDQGVNGAKGLRLVSISGDVERPGVYETPFGITLRKLVMELAGGIRGGQRLKAIALSGPSGGFLPARVPRSKLSPAAIKALEKRGALPAEAADFDILDLPLDRDLSRDTRWLCGAGMAVYGDRADMVLQALNSVEFYRNESCGKCVPCRLGTEKLARLLAELLQGSFDRGRLSVIEDLCKTMGWTSICGLGKAAPEPITTVMRYFRGDLEKYLAPAELTAGAPPA